MAKPVPQDQLFDITLQMIEAASKLPFVRVDRKAFLKKEFKDSPYLEQILANGPQSVYTVNSLVKKANKIIDKMAIQPAVAAFGLGLPGGLAAVPLAAVDVTQFFGFALNLAQQLAYLYGEDDIFDSNNGLSDEAKLRLIVYLGAMMGVAGAGALLPKVAKNVGEHVGRQLARKALMRTTWYPTVKRIGRVIGVRITREALKKGVIKGMPIIGGIIGGGLTYASFKPMGKKLSKTFVKNLKGEFEDDLELNPQFLAKINKELDQIVDAEFKEK